MTYVRNWPMLRTELKFLYNFSKRTKIKLMRTVTWKDSKRTQMTFQRASNIILRSFLFSEWTKRGSFLERRRIFSTLPGGTLTLSQMMRLPCPKNGPFLIIKKKTLNNSDENSETMNSRKNIFRRKWFFYILYWL